MIAGSEGRENIGVGAGGGGAPTASFAMAARQSWNAARLIARSVYVRQYFLPRSSSYACEVR